MITLPLVCLAAALLVLSPAASAAARTPTVAVFTDLLTADMAATAAQLVDALGKADLAVHRIGADDLANPDRFNRKAFDLLIYPAGPLYPAPALPNVRTYLQSGGRLIALGGPPFSEPAWRIDAEWLTIAAFRERLSRTPPEHVLFSFEQPADAAGWRRGTNAPDEPASLSAGDFGSSRGRSLQVDISNLTGWETFAHPVAGLPAGRQLLAFWARGEERTGQIAVELVERDGSRWIASVAIEPEWRYYLLRPADFAYWQDNPSRGRGGEGDRVQFANAGVLSVGLAFTHTQLPGGAHRFWIDEIAIRPDPLPLPAGPGSGAAPDAVVLDGLSPAYKFFPVRGVAAARAAADQAFLPAGEYPLPGELISVSPRPSGAGFLKQRPERFVPLIEAYDGNGRRAGYLAWLVLGGAPIGESSPKAGSAWAVFGVNDPAYYRQPPVVAAIVRLAGALMRQPYLYEGGAQFYAYFADDEAARLGAQVVLPVDAAADVTARVTVTRQGEAAPLFAHVWDVREEGFALAQWQGANVKVLRTLWEPAPSEWARGPFSVRTELYRGGQLVDTLVHELNVWEPKRESEREYVTARDGEFWLGRRRWYPHGVNYMPSSGIALEDPAAFEYWLDPRPYDPAVIEEDLSRIAALGMNMISVFIYHRSLASHNLLELLIRAERHGLKVNLSLRPHADPLDYRWEEVHDLLTAHRLPENDTVFAYDLAWERGFGAYEPSYSNVRGRKAYDADWEAWVIEHYGSIARAEADWGVPIPRQGGRTAGPPDTYFRSDGPWRRLVAAYRRFVDDFISKQYGRVARQIRSIDPNHLISFRMTIAGDPTAPPEQFPFDFRGLARALDIMEPEAYGRLGDWQRVRDGLFTAAYSRYAAPGRPVFWAEFGRHVWSGTNFGSNPALAVQAQFYDDFYRMIALSRASGTAAWWYAGGYRWNEKSDYGILNPDGTPRPVTRVIEEWMPKLQAPPGEPPAGDVWIEIDRDADSRGLFGIYERVRDEFWQAIEAGRTVTLHDAGTGTTSIDAPAVAVGNTPYNGANPPKYLNAEFDRLQVLDATGAWVDVTDGTIVEVAPNVPVLCRAVVGNTQVATWIADEAGRKGAAFLATPADSKLNARAPLTHDVPYLGAAEVAPFELAAGISQETTVVLQMTAWARMWFGEKVTFRLRPERK